MTVRFAMWIILWITRKVIHSYECKPVDNSVIHILSTRYPQPPVDNSCKPWYKQDTYAQNKHKIAKHFLSKIVVFTEINIVSLFGMSYPQFYINMWITLWISFKTLHKIFWTLHKTFWVKFLQFSMWNFLKFHFLINFLNNF